MICISLAYERKSSPPGVPCFGPSGSQKALQKVTKNYSLGSETKLWPWKTANPENDKAARTTKLEADGYQSVEMQSKHETCK